MIAKKMIDAGKIIISSYILLDIHSTFYSAIGKLPMLIATTVQQWLIMDILDHSAYVDSVRPRSGMSTCMYDNESTVPHVGS